MTGTQRSSSGLDARRRKLLFRSWHRGMRELDLVLGSFADAAVDDLTDAEINQYEQLLDVPDTDMLSWIMGENPVPLEHKTPLFERVASFRRTMNFSH